MKLLLSLAVLPTLITAMEAPLRNNSTVRVYEKITLADLVKHESLFGVNAGYLDLISANDLNSYLDQIVELIGDKTKLSHYYRQN